MQTEQEKNVLLASVSRSFYLTIRALPKTLRQPIRTAYLLARATDTIADTADIPVEERLKYLRLLRSLIRGHKPIHESHEIGMAISLRQSIHAEKILMTHLVELLTDLEVLEPADRADVRWVLEQITEGQEHDLTKPKLNTSEELEHYTWLVAGCVGEFWTRIGVRKLAKYACLPDEEMIRLGADFGKGLQLVNILRDLPMDLANSRSYLPELEDFEQWRQRAFGLLENGWKYVLSLRLWRLRFACALPILIGLRTLVLLGNKPPQARLKVSRREIRSTLLQTALRAGSLAALDKYYKQLLPKPGQ